jgi:hypothetical protein
VSDPRVVALIPAHDEEDRIADTVRALASIEGIADVVVVDDGSTDATGPAALGAGATVLRIPRRAGKGAAMEGALRRLPPAAVWVFADADLGRTASALEPVLREVLDGRADLAVATFPPTEDGGFGLVKRAAGRAISTLAAHTVAEPLSGQRAISAACLAAVRPLAAGFGVETAMTIDAVRAGFRVVEVPVALSHRATGRSLAGFAHRGRQGADIARAVATRVVRRR